MQTNIISKLITTADYNRAKLAMRNADSVPVQENMFSSCTATEVANCAFHVVRNFENPNYTYEMLAPYMTHAQIDNLLKKSVPVWVHTVNRFFRARENFARRVYGTSKQM